jgi:hypothetical protein
MFTDSIKVKMRSFLKAVVISSVLFGVGPATTSTSAQTQPSSLSEADAYTAVTLTTNPTARLAAAEDFLLKFPKSESRLKVAELVATELRKVRNSTVAITLIERARTIFTAREELEILKPISLVAYAGNNQSDEAFKLGTELLLKDSEDLSVLTIMSRIGADEARKRNHKHVEPALRYGLKAIALIEGGQKPEKVSPAMWDTYQASVGQLYQQTAILYLAIDKVDEARSRLTKATQLEPRDPANYALLGRILNGEYVREAALYQSIPEGVAKQETRKKLEAQLDTIIELYARATGLATGREEYQTLMQQVVPDLTSYYRLRHGQSTQGLQLLINKYRVKQ